MVSEPWPERGVERAGRTSAPCVALSGDNCWCEGPYMGGTNDGLYQRWSWYRIDRLAERTDGVGHDHVTSIYWTGRFLRFYRRRLGRHPSHDHRIEFDNAWLCGWSINAADPSLRCTLLAWELHIPDRPYPATSSTEHFGFQGVATYQCSS